MRFFVGIMNHYIDNIAEKLLGYKGFHYPVVDIQGNKTKQNLISHITVWLNQFDENERETLARLTSYLLDNFFVEEDEEILYIKSLFQDSSINQNGLVATPLIIQGNGRSQSELVQIYQNYVDEKNYRYNPKLFIYLDDFMFSGGRVFSDLSNYFSRIQENNHIIISLMGAFSYSLWNCRNKIQTKINELYSNKQVYVKIDWKIYTEFENRLSKNYCSDILWPMEGTLNLPDLNLYKLDGFNYRSGFSKSRLFLNNDDRLFLEKICLKYGYKIIERCTNVHTTTRPLGNSFYNYGFGGLIFNYRNCPNNVPLIFWWGSNNQENPMFQQWYPLIPRRGYNNG